MAVNWITVAIWKKELAKLQEDQAKQRELVPNCNHEHFQYENKVLEEINKKVDSLELTLKLVEQDEKEGVKNAKSI